MMGGLLASTVLTLVIVPLFYTYFDDLRTYVRRVMGATLGQALGVVVLPYLRLVAVAALVTTSPVIVLSLRWLEAYPERISGFTVLAGAVCAVCVTLAGTAGASGWQALGWTRKAVTQTLRLG